MPRANRSCPGRPSCRSSARILVLLFSTGLLLSSVGCRATTFRPADDFVAPPPDLSLEARLRHHVEVLAGEIGERHCYRPENYERAAAYTEGAFIEAGVPAVRQEVAVPEGEPFLCGPTTAFNIVATIPGKTLPSEILVVGAHYDTKVATPHWHDHGPPEPERPGTPGAHDNATGVAGLIEVARALADEPLDRTVIFVAYANEEPPFFRTDSMGSRVHARSLAEDPERTVTAMVCLEQLGCFSRTEGRKRRWWVGLFGLNDRTDYIAFLCNPGSRRVAKEAARVFVETAPIPVKVMPVPRVSDAVAWSDDSSYWEHGIPAFSVCDTAYLRNDHYHELTDTPDTVDYPPMAEVVRGCIALVRALANFEE